MLGCGELTCIPHFRQAHMEALTKCMSSVLSDQDAYFWSFVKYIHWTYLQLDNLKLLLSAMNMLDQSGETVSIPPREWLFADHPVFLIRK